MIGDQQGRESSEHHQLHDLFEGVGNCMLLLLFLGGAQGLVGVVFGLKRRDVK